MSLYNNLTFIVFMASFFNNIHIDILKLYNLKLLTDY